MQVLRTPEERFAGLDGYDFAPRYRVVVADDGTPLRFHFVDEGPRQAPPVLLLHGNPTWSYLHRHMVRGLVERGHRVVALDLMGMGRSDKPADPEFYTLARHLDWMSQWLLGEDLREVTLYGQDWGGSTGLLLATRHPDRFARLIASNTGLPVGEGVPPFLQAWLELTQSVPELDIGGLVSGGTTRSLTAAEQRAYWAPFPDAAFQVCVKRFPLLIPLQPDNPGVPLTRAAWRVLETWTKPFLTVFGDRDPVTKGAHVKFQQLVPGARGQAHAILPEANHFIQEDAPRELVDIIDAFTRVPSAAGATQARSSG
ncbi:MAG: haloalkane dehalogenase [Deltaproteobacteria bacterium]|nr:haloalkane dehalogenase [Deltaproteobacteria bacterium]